MRARDKVSFDGEPSLRCQRHDALLAALALDEQRISIRILDLQLVSFHCTQAGGEQERHECPVSQRQPRLAVLCAQQFLDLVIRQGALDDLFQFRFRYLGEWVTVKNSFL